MSFYNPSRKKKEGLGLGLGLGLGGRDCFRHLPDDLIVHILSFVSTDQAVRTSAVSKRWHRLWVRVPSREIKIPFLKRDKELVFLEAALALHATPNGKVAWTTLRALEVANATLRDDLVANLLVGCPALESPRLRLFEGIRKIDATSATKLKELVMEDCLQRKGSSLHQELCIVAPNLQELELTGDWNGIYPELINVDSLVKAKIDFVTRQVARDRHRITVMKVLGMVRRCEELKVGPLCLQVLLQNRIDLSRYFLSSPRHVVVHISYSGIELFNVLQCFPALEQLTVDFIHPHREDLIGPPSLLFSKFKVVKLIIIRKGGWWVKFAEFLLKNLTTLEEMVICPHPKSSLLTKRFCLLTEAIKDLQRSSPRAIVTFRRNA